MAGHSVVGQYYVRSEFFLSNFNQIKIDCFCQNFKFLTKKLNLLIISSQICDVLFVLLFNISNLLHYLVLFFSLFLPKLYFFSSGKKAKIWPKKSLF